MRTSTQFQVFQNNAQKHLLLYSMNSYSIILFVGINVGSEGMEDAGD